METFIYHTHLLSTMTEDEFGKHCDAHSVDMMGVLAIQCRYCNHKSVSYDAAKEHFKTEHADRYSWNVNIKCPTGLEIKCFDDMKIDYDDGRFELVFDIPTYGDISDCDYVWKIWTANVLAKNIGKSLSTLHEKHKIALDGPNIRLEARTNDKEAIIYTIWWRRLVA